MKPSKHLTLTSDAVQERDMPYGKPKNGVNVTGELMRCQERQRKLTEYLTLIQRTPHGLTCAKTHDCLCHQCIAARAIKA